MNITQSQSQINVYMQLRLVFFIYKFSWIQEGARPLSGVLSSLKQTDVSRFPKMPFFIIARFVNSFEGGALLTRSDIYWRWFMKIETISCFFDHIVTGIDSWAAIVVTSV